MVQKKKVSKLKLFCYMLCMFILICVFMDIDRLKQEKESEGLQVNKNHVSKPMDKYNECVTVCVDGKAHIESVLDYWGMICDQTEYQKGDAGLDKLIKHCSERE